MDTSDQLICANCGFGSSGTPSEGKFTGHEGDACPECKSGNTIGIGPVKAEDLDK